MDKMLLHAETNYAFSLWLAFNDIYGLLNLIANVVKVLHGFIDVLF